MAAPDCRILDAFYDRLLSAISRSPLLKVAVSKTGRLLDCSRLETLQPKLGKQVLKAVIGNEGRVSIDLPWRLVSPVDASQPEQEEPAFKSDEERRAQRVANEQKLLEQMLIRIVRYGALAKRETGVHAIWLGFPLVYVAVAETEPLQQLLAPVFLWPIAADPDRRHQGRYLVGRNAEVGPPQFNWAMAAWIKNKLQLELCAPGEDDLEDLAWTSLPKQLQAVANGFPNSPVVNLEDELRAIPRLTELRSYQSPQIFNSAVLGYFRWQNEAILADIDALKDMTDCESPVTGFVTGVPLEKSDLEIPIPSEEDRFEVCDADFSQERVVWKARAKPGLVVHGPPGTGKSQTIVNIIADALAHGRTVLMVCQKQAATRVVLERLRKAGLADLCMEVHDPESERVPVFKAIRGQVQMLPASDTAAKTQARRQQLAREIGTLKHELDNIARGLHEKQPDIGLSYCQIKAREGQIFGAYPSVRSLRPLEKVLAGMSAQAVDDASDHVQAVGRWFREANPLNNPWRDHQPNLQVSPVTKEDFDTILSRLHQLDANHKEQIERNGTGFPLPPNVAEFAQTAPQLLARLQDLANNLQVSRSVLTLRWLKAIRSKDANELQGHRQRCVNAVALSAQVKDSPLDPEWDQVCGPLSEALLQRLRLHAERVLANRGLWWRYLNPFFAAARRAIQRIRPQNAAKTCWDAAADLLVWLKARELRDNLTDLNRSLVPGVEASLSDDKAHARYCISAGESLETAAWLSDQERKYHLITPILDTLLSNRQGGSADHEILGLSQTIRRVDAATSLIRELARFEAFLLPHRLAPAREDILAGKPIKAWLDRLSGGFQGLAALFRWEIDRRGRTGPLGAILNSLEDYEQCKSTGESLPTAPSNILDEKYGDWWRAMVQCAAVTTWLTSCHQKYPELLEFLPEQHEQKRARLRNLLNQKRELEAETIREFWHAQQAPVRDGPWNRMFQLRGADAKRLRQAVELSLPRGLLNLRPCWLADPGTAAQIFPRKSGLFDLVIFDEASQCPIEYAVPAIYRGKTLVVSGDAKQLPPTSFFSTRVQQAEDEEDETDADASDETISPEDRQLRQINTEFLMTVEDLLDASIGNLPEDRLLVHYRSDHPRLIEFSNRAFYQGQLEAPPARASRLGKPPIEYSEVNGVYENRTNRKEASKVVELVKSMWATHTKCPTVGVVTFNGPQRDLIEDLLEKECQADSAFAALYQQELDRKDENQDVGFFVKNLENVQGDERDVMIFSTTFGPNANGVFYRRFGPVGAERGERRLNVAVTRAKQRIIVVGSMPIDQVSEALNAAQAPGMNLKPRCYLQLYLAYARAVSTGDENQIKRILDRLSYATTAVQTQDDAESPLEEEVLAVLEKRGYTVRCQVGESGFRIDLAVLHHDPSQGYLLGIECDGATYHADRAAHLRDVWRETILRRRGWKMHRIWSTRWWYHRAEEIEKLENALLTASLHDETSLTTTAEENPVGVSAEVVQTLCDATPTQNPVGELAVTQSTMFPTPKFDGDMTLGQAREKLAMQGEFRGSWERFLAFMKLPLGSGLTSATTVAEAYRIANELRSSRISS